MTPSSVMPRFSISGIAAASSSRSAASTAPIRAVGPRQRVRAGGAREVAEAQPQGHRAPGRALGPHPPGHAVDEADQHGVELVRRAAPPPQRRLGPEGAPAAPGAHAAAIPAEGHRVQPPATAPPRISISSSSERAAASATVSDPRGLQPLGGGGAHAPELAHAERVQELELAAGRDQQQAVGLRLVAGHLRDELRAGDADRRAAARPPRAPARAAGPRSPPACPRSAPARGRRGRPRRSRASRRSERCPQIPRTRPCSPPSTPPSGTRRPRRRGTAAAPSRRSWPSARRTRAPRSWPPAPPPGRRSPAGRAAPGSSRCSTEA